MSNLATLAANAAATAATTASGSSPPWRHFPFFEVVPVKDVNDLDSSPDILKTPMEISTTASSSRGVLVADIFGSIHLLNSDFESINSWIAHTGGRVTHMIERKGILVTLGEEDAVKSPLLKIWDMQNQDKKTNAPLLLRSTKVQLSNRPHPVTTVALSAAVSHLAIGLGDGTVLLYRHIDQSLASSTSLTSLPKVRTVHESPTEPITGLGFKEPTEENPNSYLFVVTTHRVLSYQASGKGSGGTATVVDEVGASLGCAIMDWRMRDIVVARDEAIYFCGTDGRGPCYAYEGHKSSIHTHLNYFVIVSPPFVATASAPSATVRNFAIRTGATGDVDITKVTVFDSENKLVAYSGTFKEGVREIISQWGQVYVLTTDGKLLCLQEKSTAAKLDMLYRKALYPVALNLGKTQNLDESSIADIHKQYGDHLYSKSDFDGAMNQFVQTIGHVQPSYVIRKFLDAQRIHNLVTYLQELHSLGLANSDHTTLLLNTYTKLKDVSRLDSFIKTESRRNSDNPDELPFDLETAIRVCRQAGYFEHASYLAKKYERHEDYLRIQIEDAENYKDALSYLRMLGPEAAESNLARYGQAMLANLPDETTQLLIDLCTSTGSLTTDSVEETSTIVTVKAAPTPSYLSYLVLNRNNTAAPTASSDTATPPSPSIKTVKPDNLSRKGSVHDVSRPITPPAPSTSAISNRINPPPLRKLSPRLYFAHFVDHMEQFVVFLETVALRRWGQTVDDKKPGSIGLFSSSQDGSVFDEEVDKMDQVSVWNTLLELYLTLPRPVGSGDKASSAFDETIMRDKAMRVLRDDSLPFDPMHALVLCSTHGYTDGLVLLWERMGMYEEVLRFWMNREKEGNCPGASQKVVTYLMQYGADHPHLFPVVLRFLTSSSELLSKHQEDLRNMLEHIEEENIMPPLGVIQVLSRNEVASVGLVKDWLMARIKKSTAEIQNDKELTNSYVLETAAKLKQVQKLSDPDRPHVFHITRCSECGGQLDLPSVHFMCNHSFHQRCLSEHEAECPKCAREHSVIREIRLNNQRIADHHDVFLAEVQETGFEAVAAAFSRGMLNMPRTEQIT